MNSRSSILEKVTQEKIQLEYELSIAKSRSIDSSSKSEINRVKGDLKCSMDQIRRLESDLDRVMKKWQEHIDEKSEDQVAKLSKTLETYQKEISRYRKERDEMREMYETANNQVSSLNKHCSHLQIMVDSLKSKVQILESKERKLADAIKGTAYSEDTFLTELETIGVAFQNLQNHNQSLLKEISEKDGLLQVANADKIKLEFKMSQILKDAEVSTKKAEEIERSCHASLNNAFAKERNLLATILSLEKEILDKNKHIDDLRKKLADSGASISELERNIRHLRADLEEVCF